ncbi:MAG: histidine kinase [Melioribacteraceae bacterium]|nr:histidine kinase [Melioribacteraceae bacterium]MCF8263417.1 histidine kinase [Melioribacteraceae bacterium]MCF8414251.1 histidine kinase [Melioribacteraceae bacterium]MCF8430415.1 histidine kinase [Melioribacteraceae bacterium]
MGKKSIEILINILFWTGTLWLILNSFSITFHEIQIENGIETVEIIRDSDIILELSAYLSVALLLFYLNLFLFHKYLSSKVHLIWYSSGLVFLSILGWLIVSSYLQKVPSSISIGVILFYYSISAAYGLAKNWLRSEHQKQKLIAEKKQFQLTLLRNQLQPHFLFNALNNLLSMVDQKKSPLLAESIEKLSFLLRYVVEENSAEKVSVKNEIEFLRNYSELQLLRFEKGEVDFKLSVNGNFDEQLVEPGVFVSFIENAFKYGTEPETHSKIEVNFDLSSHGKIKFLVKNKTLHKSVSIQNPRTGISSVKKRLELIYPDKHKLRIISNENFLVDMELITDESNNS